MQKRIDRLAETGLDLMMTEFDIGWPDVVERADWFEDAVRAFFGHPKMTGMILWGFHNDSMKDPDHELVTGPNAYNLTVRASSFPSLGFTVGCCMPMIFLWPHFVQIKTHKRLKMYAF